MGTAAMRQGASRALLRDVQYEHSKANLRRSGCSAPPKTEISLASLFAAPRLASLVQDARPVEGEAWPVQNVVRLM